VTRATWPECSPLRNFVRNGSVLPDRACRSLQIGTCSSEQPFALLRGLPASGPPSQGRCSWPIPSAQNSDLTEPVRSLAPSRSPVSPEQRKLIACDPLPGSIRASSTVPQLSTPVWGLLEPLPIKAFKLTTSREAHRIETPDLLRSPLPAVFNRPAADQCSKTRQSTHSRSEPSPRNDLSLF